MGTHSMAGEVLPQAGANLFSLTCKLLQGNKISSDHQNNLVVGPTCGNIILDCLIKTCNGWVPGVKYLQEMHDKRAQTATAPHKRINNLHIELGHPSNTIIHTTTKALSIQDTSMLKTCENCALGKAKQCAIS